MWWGTSTQKVAMHLWWNIYKQTLVKIKKKFYYVALMLYITPLIKTHRPIELNQLILLKLNLLR